MNLGKGSIFNSFINYVIHDFDVGMVCNVSRIVMRFVVSLDKISSNKHITTNVVWFVIDYLILNGFVNRLFAGFSASCFRIQTSSRETENPHQIQQVSGLRGMKLLFINQTK